MTADSGLTPSEVVHRQIEAYNDGDSDEFASWYAEDAVVMRLEDGERMAEGREEIRTEWGDLFEAVPDLHCEVTDEVAVGQFVAHRERVTGMDEPLDALAVYLVDDGAIQRVYLGGQ